MGQFINHTNLLTKEAVLNEISEKIPEYMVPNYVEILDKMPLTGNGKLDRKTMASMIVSEESKIEGAGNELKEGLEKKIGEIWKKALNRENIYRDENFYKVGGDSLLLAQIVSQMKETIEEFHSWDWNLIMTSIIQNPTIAGIAEKALERAEQTEATDVVVATETGNSSLKVLKEVKESNRAAVS